MFPPLPLKGRLSRKVQATPTEDVQSECFYPSCEIATPTYTPALEGQYVETITPPPPPPHIQISHLSPPHPPYSTLPTFTSVSPLSLRSPSLRPSLPSHIYPLPASVPHDHIPPFTSPISPIPSPPAHSGLSAPHDHFPPFTSPISPIPSPSHTQWSASWSSVVSGRMRRKLLRESRQPSTSTWLVPSESSRGASPLLLHTTSMYSR